MWINESRDDLFLLKSHYVNMNEFMECLKDRSKLDNNTKVVFKLNKPTFKPSFEQVKVMATINKFIPSNHLQTLLQLYYKLIHIGIFTYAHFV